MEQMKLRLKKWWGITQRYSIFYICFVSYLFVLLFSVLFNIYNYNAYISELKNQKSLYDQMMFQQFDEMINAELTKVDSLLVNVMMDSDILQVVASNDIIAAGQISQTYEAAASMRSYSGEVTNLYIYFESNDAIIMDGAYYRPEKFYQQIVDHAAYDFEEWHVAQRESYYRQYGRSYSADPNEFILYHTISTITGRKALVAIAFSLEDAFSVFQESFFAGEMVFQITSEDGKVLADFGYEDFEEDHGRQTEPYTSTRTGWTFVSAIPSDVYDSRAASYYDVVGFDDDRHFPHNLFKGQGAADRSAALRRLLIENRQVAAPHTLAFAHAAFDSIEVQLDFGCHAPQGQISPRLFDCVFHSSYLQFDVICHRDYSRRTVKPSFSAVWFSAS